MAAVRGPAPSWFTCARGVREAIEPREMAEGDTYLEVAQLNDTVLVAGGEALVLALASRLGDDVLLLAHVAGVLGGPNARKAKDGGVGRGAEDRVHHVSAPAPLLGLLGRKRAEVVLDAHRVGRALVGRGGLRGLVAQPDGDVGLRVDLAVALRLAQRADDARVDVLVADDARVGLRAAGVDDALARRAVGDCGPSLISSLFCTIYRSLSCEDKEKNVPVRPGILTPLAP